MAGIDGNGGSGGGTLMSVGRGYTTKKPEPTPEAFDFDAIWSHIQMTHAGRQANILSWRRRYYSEDMSREPLWEGGSAIELPVINWVVELIHDRLYLSQFGVGDSSSIMVKAYDLKNTETATMLEKVLQFFHRRGSKHRAISLALRDAILLGAGVVRIYWDGKMLRTEWVPLENFYVLNPQVEPLDGVFAHVYYKRKGELISLAKRNRLDVDVDTVTAMLGTSETLYEVPNYQQTISLPSADAPQKGDVIKLVDIFYRDDDGIIKQATYAPDNRIVLYHRRFTYNKFPFFVLRFIPKGYGEGLSPLLEPLEEELSVLHNQRIDNNTLRNLPLFKVLSTSPALRDREEWYAGKKIEVDTQDDIQPLVMPEPISGYQDEIQMLDYIKLISGVSELLSGNPLRGERTAFEVESALAEGSVRFRRYTKFVAEWMEQQAWFELEILSKQGVKEVVKFLGRNPFSLIDTERLEYEYEIVAPTILTNKEMERQLWLLIRNILVQEPMVVSNPERWYEVLRQLLIAFGVDHRKLIGDPPGEQRMEQSVPDLSMLTGLAGEGGAPVPPEVMMALAQQGGNMPQTIP